MRIGTFLAPRLRPLYEAAARAAGEALGEPVQLVEDGSFDELLDGRMHAAFLCGLPYVKLRERAGRDVAPLAAPVLAGRRYASRPVYFSDVVVRAGDTARDVFRLPSRQRR